MLARSETVLHNSPIWDFALAFYDGEGVSVDCLRAQDIYGLDVTALIFALYRARLGVSFDAAIAVELARTFSSRIIEPLRNARIALKQMPPLVATEAAQALRERVKAAELGAEKLVLDALMALPFVGQSHDYEQALWEIVRASEAGEDPDLKTLLKRLAMRAQNM
jgi:uncharacterized protein (TIGR02444 family)